MCFPWRVGVCYGDDLGEFLDYSSLLSALAIRGFFSDLYHENLVWLVVVKPKHDPLPPQDWFLGLSHCLAGSHVASRSSNYCSSVSTSWWLQGLLLQVSTSWMLYLSGYACFSRFWARGLPFNITFLMKPRKVFGSWYVELLRMDGMMASKLFTCRI